MFIDLDDVIKPRSNAKCYVGKRKARTGEDKVQVEEGFGVDDGV